MSTQPQSAEGTIEFLEKLADFHESLPPDQQAMLDGLTAAALTERDVEGHMGGAANGLKATFRSGSLPPRPYYRAVVGLIDNA